MKIDHVNESNNKIVQISDKYLQRYDFFIFYY